MLWVGTLGILQYFSWSTTLCAVLLAHMTFYGEVINVTKTNLFKFKKYFLIRKITGSRIEVNRVVFTHLKCLAVKSVLTLKTRIQPSLIQNFNFFVCRKTKELNST